MGNKYWDGTEHAVLKKADVTADWINHQWGARGLGVTNKAFCIWYHARTSADNSGSSKMVKTLENCGYSGWGSGVDDLDEAFKHIVKNGGKWTDNTSSYDYNGTSGEYRGGKKGIHVSHKAVPASARNFLTAVDKILPKFQTAMKTYQDQCVALQAIKLKPTSPKSEWENMNKRLDQIKKTAEKVSDYAWLAPATISAALPPSSVNYATINSVSDFTEKVTTRTTQTVKFLGAVGKITGALDMYVKATSSFNGDKRIGVAFAGLTLAMDYVPVLGGFYGEIIKQIPGLVSNWKVFIADYTRKLDDPVAYLRAQQNAPPKWRCEYCNSM